MKMKCDVRFPENKFIMRHFVLRENFLFSLVQKFKDAFSSWRSRETCGIVPSDRIRELFNELNFSPTDKQVNDMLQTAKQFARRCNLESAGGRSHLDGLTFGEFCVLLADFRRFRTCSIMSNHDSECNSEGGESQICDFVGSLRSTTTKNFVTERSIPIDRNSSVTNCPSLILAANGSGVVESPSATTSSSDCGGPEVFLGGSCNPTTWRADVAIPTLQTLGISFYNPQVSDWTPDLIELEHRAKEKARVLFFVIDSETRASAGAIEAAHIAGQNSKHLVLVLHPYKPHQKILNEPISTQEYIDLTRNQNLLRELVLRRGLPILDSIPSGLQRTKAILSGNEGQSPPSNIASRLISVRRAFDRICATSVDEITTHECQLALSYLGYTNSIISHENIRKIVITSRDVQKKQESIFKRHIYHHHHHQQTSSRRGGGGGVGEIKGALYINFEEFCVIAAYLWVLQQEMNENTCVSPIKGTNLPPPPIFLTNTPVCGIEYPLLNKIHGVWRASRDALVDFFSDFIHKLEWIHKKQEASSPVGNSENDGDGRKVEPLYTLRFKSSPSISRESQRKRDSGTSSPLPQESSGSSLVGRDSTTAVPQFPTRVLDRRSGRDDEEDNDSVFSDDAASSESSCSDSSTDMRDIYLGGSCMRRSRWREDYVIPVLKARGMTYHLPDEGGGFDVEATTQMPEKRLKINNHLVNDDEVVSEQTELNLVDDDPIQHLINEPLFNPTLLDSSRVLLFVITNETRSLAPMTLAAHYIGLGYDVVLCVQMLVDSIIGNERLTQAAIKDYNRGRDYLKDLAKRQGIPVYSDIQAALECAIERANMHKSIASI
ncbi:raw [Sergentomyia squamirostris]